MLISFFAEIRLVNVVLLLLFVFVEYTLCELVASWSCLEAVRVVFVLNARVVRVYVYGLGNAQMVIKLLNV